MYLYSKFKGGADAEKFKQFAPFSVGSTPDSQNTIMEWNRTRSELF